MTFAQTIDPRWHRRHSGSRRIGKRGVPPPPHPSYHDHANLVRALPFSDGIAALSHPIAGVVAEEKQQQQPSRINNSGVVPLPLPLRRVDRAPFGRLDDLTVVPAGSAPQRGRGGQQPQGGGASDWSMEGVLGYGARVLALSMYSEK